MRDVGEAGGVEEGSYVALEDADDLVEHVLLMPHHPRPLVDLKCSLEVGFYLLRLHEMMLLQRLDEAAGGDELLVEVLDGLPLLQLQKHLGGRGLGKVREGRGGREFRGMMTVREREGTGETEGRGGVVGRRVGYLPLDVLRLLRESLS